MREQGRALEALSEVLPAHKWHPSWAAVVSDEWLDVLDAFDKGNVENPVGVLVRRLRRLTAEHDPTTTAPEMHRQPLKRKPAPLSYAEYFRG